METLLPIQQRGAYECEAAEELPKCPSNIIEARDFEIMNVVKSKRKELKKILELHYGLMDQLVSEGLCDLEQVQLLQNTRSTTRRPQLVNKLVEALSSTAEDKMQFLEFLKRNYQRHLAVFIAQEGRRFPYADVAHVNCWPLDAVRKSRIARNMRVLVEQLDPDIGLVREWASNGCINHQQCRDIEQTSPQFNRNRKLLNFLLKRSVADYNLFVDCLKKFGQGHLAELLEISEVEKGGKTENVPVPQNWKFELQNLLELNYGLLDDMVSGGLIEYEDQYEDLDVGRVLDLMVGKSPTDNKLFLEALKATGQEHVASFITRNGCRYGSDDKMYNCWPLDPSCESRVMRNFCQLIELIEPDNYFVSALYRFSCINSLQNCELIETRNGYDKTRKVLNFLLQSSITGYENFVKCLKTTSQHHLASILENDAVVETVDFTIANGSIDEEEIVERWKEVLKTNDDVTKGVINSVLHEEVNPGVEMVDMKIGHSVRCYLLCKTPTALKILYQKLDNESLTATMQSIFSSLLGGKDRAQVVQAKGRLSTAELQRRIEVFSKDIDCGVTSDLTQGDADCGVTSDLTQGDADCGVTSDLTQGDAALVCSFKESIWSHYDVLEPILLRVAVVLFKTNRLRLLLPRPDVTTLITVSSVCRDWRDAIEGRKFNRRRLKQTFKMLAILPVELFKAAVLLRRNLLVKESQRQWSPDADVIVWEGLASVCRRWKAAISDSGDLKRRRIKRLFHYNKLLVTLDQPPPPSESFGDRSVQGVTTLENYLYVIYSDYNKVEVFDCEDRFKKVKDIEVSGVRGKKKKKRSWNITKKVYKVEDHEVQELDRPYDMVSCAKLSQLIISEEWWLIWRVDLKTGVSHVDVSLSHPGYMCPRLSLVEDRLLVKRSAMGTAPSELIMYDIYSSKKVSEIPLKLNNIWYAIESNRDSFIIIHGDYSERTVSEIDSKGRVTRMFNSEKCCVDMALDSLGRLLVADASRVVLLNEHFKYLRILIDENRLGSRPWRLDYNKNKKRLTMGLLNGHVKIFDLSLF